MLASFTLTSYNPIDASTTNSVSTRYDKVTAEKVTGKVDLSAVVMDNLSSSVVESDYYSSVTKSQVQTVIFTLKQPAVIDYLENGQSVADYVTTAEGVKVLNKIEKSQKEFLNALKLKGVSYELVDSFNTVINAVAVKMSIGDATSVSGLDMVIGSEVSETYAYPKAITAQENPSNVYETGIYDTSEYAKYGTGVTVAVLDTGLDYTHEAFSIQPEELALEYGDVNSKMDKLKATQRSLKKGDNITADDLYLSDKVPFAYDYADDDADVYPSYSQHGVHVAGIIAGQSDFYTDKEGNIAKDADGNVLSFRGSAPDAQLVICKVFTDDLDDKDIGGATAEDIIAALEDCVTLGVDVINMSLGTSAGFSSITIDGDTEGQALNKIYGSIQEQGISLMCAASNDYSSGFGGNYGTNLTKNPDSGTVGSPSTFIGAMSVASINGLKSPYMISNGEDAVFYEESSDANGVENDFAEEMLGSKQSGTFKYVVIPGIGQAVDYTDTIKSLLADKEVGEKVIAVVKRGSTSFKDKVELAALYADAIIIYNNVAGTVRMNLGDLDVKIPAISVSIDAGNALVSKAVGSVGSIEINKTYLAGPFMNDYSSWGATPDLKLKPDITAHGGEITSTVAGGYTEMSGTSMATPNLAGLTALVRSYLKEKFPSLNNVELKELVNQVMMSTATTVYDQTGLPYSPRKQGAGLAVLESIMQTKAYLYTDATDGGAEENRPKIELGEGTDGNYTLKFFVKNYETLTGDNTVDAKNTLSFSANTMFFSETVARGGLAVAEKAYYLDGDPVWKVNGKELSTGETFTVAPGEVAEIVVNITMTDADKAYITKNFENGMFVEGFLKLVSTTDGQCDLTLPFMGFYGDWESSQMLDYNCFEIAEFEKDTSLLEDEKPQASVFATQAFAMYYNNKYVVPMGSFAYLQDEFADQMYTNEDYAAISCYNTYYGEGNTSNYMTTTGIKALYAGLLRNAELVTYEIYDAETGEILMTENAYRVGKAYAAGGRGVPGHILMEYTPEDLGLVANGKYKIDFHFYFKAEDVNDPEKQNDGNTFSMTFYVDYEAPLLVDSRIRYYDYEDGNQIKQRVYLDIDIFDNHYAQAVMLCYAERDMDGQLQLKLATEYVTPIYNPNKNGLTTVTIEITDFYEKYKDRLYVQIDDYALNYNVYAINLETSKENNLPADFSFKDGTELTIGVNQAKRIELNYEGDKNIANFKWESSNPAVVKVKDGEIFGVKAGTATITVYGGNKQSQKLKIIVEDKGLTLKNPNINFNVIENAQGSIEKAQGTVEVNAGSKFTLEVVTDPWYYPLENLNLKWNTGDETIAKVSQDGYVEVFDKEGVVLIEAVVMNGDVETAVAASVFLDVQDPFTVSNMILTKYHGTGGVVRIPDDKNIMYIGQEAFKDNEDVTAVIIPKTVTQIDELAFQNCINLEYVYFVSEEKQEIADADLSMILRYAFIGCTSLKKVDLSNVKIITVDKYAFENCTALEEVVAMHKIGKMDDRAFAGCTSLKKADISGLHTSGNAVFKNCSSLIEVITDKYTVIGKEMFSGCRMLNEVTIKMANVADSAFDKCVNLEKVTFGDQTTAKDIEFVIGANAFSSCVSLTEVDFNGYNVKKIGNGAFSNCEILEEITLPVNNVVLGDNVFENSPTVIKLPDGGIYGSQEDGSIYVGTVLYKAPATINSSFAIKQGTTEISPYAFQGSKFDGVTTVAIPNTVTVIGEGAFANTAITTISLPNGITKIPDYAFGESNISTITLGNNIVSIGNGAFYGCKSLNTVTFEENSLLKTIGDNAFAGCTALKEITLPDKATTMGNRVFADCTALEEVTLPSVEQMGNYTFSNTPELTTVVYGKNACTTGNYTFAQDYYTVQNGAYVSKYYDSKLTKVTFGDNTYELGEYVFYVNKNLTQIDLNNITKISMGAFCICENLTTVTGLDKVTDIGVAAFRECSKLQELNLDSATFIGNSAFAVANTDNAFTSVNIPVARVIEDYAFFGGNQSSVNIPKTLEKLGDGAFGNSDNLLKFTIDADSKNFNVFDGVLYRVLEDGKYELSSYPSAKTATFVNSIPTYAVVEGTVTIQAFAFSEINAGTVKKVILPYSVKTIGDGAFYKSGVVDYQFESINAPALLYSFMETGIVGFRSLLNKNFEKNIMAYAVDFGVEGAVRSELKISYPTNGIGYDNYIYQTFFGVTNLLGELEEDATRSARVAVESFADANTIASWVNNDQITKKFVEDFANKVKNARLTYNNIKGDVQREYFGADNLEKLTQIEVALKTVKAHFGIAVNVTGISVSADSTHKTTYKVGEKFDMTGLKVIVTYDDYSSEEADMSKISVLNDKAFGKYDRTVTISGYGKTMMILVTITEEGGSDPIIPDTGDTDGGSGCGSVLSEQVFMASITALALVACIIISKRVTKRK